MPSNYQANPAVSDAPNLDSEKPTPDSTTSTLTLNTQSDAEQYFTTDMAVTLGLLTLTLFICGIIYWQFHNRRQTPPTPKNATPADPNNAETDAWQHDAPHHTTAHHNTEAAPPQTQPLAPPDEAPTFLPDHFQHKAHFEALIAPLGLEPIQPGQWLPQHLWGQFDLTKDHTQGLTVFHYAAPIDLDYVLIMGQYLENTPTETQADQHTANPLRLVMILRSYRLSIAPDPVNIYSHALETTAEGFHDTVLLYKTAQAAPLAAYQQFLTDGLAIFESLATPPNADQRDDWLNC